jgi:hypothetical protein
MGISRRIRERGKERGELYKEKEKWGNKEKTATYA